MRAKPVRDKRLFQTKERLKVCPEYRKTIAARRASFPIVKLSSFVKEDGIFYLRVDENRSRKQRLFIISQWGAPQKSQALMCPGTAGTNVTLAVVVKKTFSWR